MMSLNVQGEKRTPSGESLIVPPVDTHSQTPSDVSSGFVFGKSAKRWMIVGIAIGISYILCIVLFGLVTDIQTKNNVSNLLDVLLLSLILIC